MWVVIFSVAMAWVESSVVVYLRGLIVRLQPFQGDPLPRLGVVGNAEIIREGATLVMLFVVGRLAGTTRRSRWALSLLAFGVWDLLYYLFLILLVGWPRSLLDWDILFLIPLPWWGPVLAPAIVSLVFVVGGMLVGLFDTPELPLWPVRPAVVAGAAGIVPVLYSFMATSVRALPDGIEAVRKALPSEFPWVCFLVGLVLLMIPVLDVMRQLLRRLRR